MKKFFLICAVALFAVACGNKVDSLLDKLKAYKAKVEKCTSAKELQQLSVESMKLLEEVQALNEDELTSAQKERLEKIMSL